MDRLCRVKGHLSRTGHVELRQNTRSVLVRSLVAGGNADLDSFRPNKALPVLDSTISYYESQGPKETVIFLHGNPTNSFLWRKVIKVMEQHGFRCVAPDLIGFGRSGDSSEGYRFKAHAKYLDSFFERLDFEKAYLVIHDWGSALGFRWARKNPSKVLGIVHMESIVKPFETWSEFPEIGRRAFQNMRKKEAGEAMVIENNFFIERLLLEDKIQRAKHPLTEEEKAVYRERFTAKSNRERILQWPREIPIEGVPADVTQEVASSFEFMTKATFPVLFIEAKPGFFSSRIKRLTQSWPTQTTYGPVVGLHFIQEDSGEEIGHAIHEWINHNSTHRQ